MAWRPLALHQSTCRPRVALGGACAVALATTLSPQLLPVQLRAPREAAPARRRIPPPSLQSPAAPAPVLCAGQARSGTNAEGDQGRRKKTLPGDISAYINEVMSDKSLVSGPLSLLLTEDKEDTMIRGVVETLVGAFRSTVEGMNDPRDPTQLFGQIVHFEVVPGSGPLHHRGVPYPWGVLETVANVLLADPRVECSWVPDGLERQMYINCLRVCSAVCSDMLLSLRSEVAAGHYASDWTQRDERWPPDAETLRDAVAEALTRIDFDAVNRIVEDWVQDEDPGFVEKVMGTERFMYRTGVILALVFFHAYFAHCEMTMMGCSIRIGLKRRGVGAARASP